ncbi:HTH-type transcriptional regulator DmlR [Pigmentiphaga humi]|uniref:HTH-type transcriptional regulator DmlR n=1 Tax=Pigmentiphaga humi TaxID=2478468 RepID=A0A3P4AXC8_9BURK|nr:LysR substrate-binding domain-containing protein [Pigmentiphaga humi]VCU68050.1 HTH-type transcriptional regulator DmlR [Pigmentiphaga humi]
MSHWAGIEEFYTVAQGRSFTQAARRLGLSASQVSREVARLEDRLGQRLLYRSTRRVSLTEAGERFFVRCRQLLEDRDEALAAILDESALLQGTLRMTCSERFIVPMINRFMLSHPQLKVDVLLWNEHLDLVDEGMDLAIRFGQLSDSRLVASRLGSRTRYLCAAPAYIEARGAPRTLEELDSHDSICGADEFWHFTLAGQPCAYRPSGRFRCNSGYAVIDAVRLGLGLCQLPDFYVEEHLRAGTLVELLAAHRPQEEAVWAVYPHRRHVPRKVRLAVEHLQREFEARKPPALPGLPIGGGRPARRRRTA